MSRNVATSMARWWSAMRGRQSTRGYWRRCVHTFIIVDTRRESMYFPHSGCAFGSGAIVFPIFAWFLGEESEDILTSPPLIWIEILSPEDRPIRVQQKVCEVLDFGCPWVWVIDPETLESRIYTATSDYSPEDATF